MAIKITDDCINCGACEPECPNNAIYEGDEVWKFSDGTTLTDNTTQDPLEEDFYYIVTDKCTECVGFFDEPQCAAVCPVDCCLSDENHIETQDELLVKKQKLHS